MAQKDTYAQNSNARNTQGPDSSKSPDSGKSPDTNKGSDNHEHDNYGMNYDIVIIGGGLAGQTLARHLLLETGKSILLLERRSELPREEQKVGESTVQIAGYYFSKVLQLEKYLFDRHYMKYNLRFYWRGEGPGTNFQEYGQSYIRNFSNIASFQIDRNVFEEELMRLNQENPRFSALLNVRSLQVDLSESGAHSIRFHHNGQPCRIGATWVIDCSGRGKVLARKENLTEPAPINHGAFFWWVDGLVDIESLSDASAKERRLHRDRQHTGHLPHWLATNHFCDEGLWLWVIPLQDKTSLGLVYDNSVHAAEDLFSVEKATEYACRLFPLFARDLPQRKVLDHGGYRRFSHGCQLTLSSKRWAMSGEAGRFSDPLYSPGSDLISIYNTLIVDAVQTDDPEELRAKCLMHEQLMKAVFQAYLPTYGISYDALGDQETFSLKYTWELTTYFAIFVFPFINDLYQDRRFILAFLRLFTRLGPINLAMQHFLSAYFQWKKDHGLAGGRKAFFDFTQVCTLHRAAETFYAVGLSVTEAKKVQNEQAAGIRELARFIAAFVASRVLGEPDALHNRRFVESFDIEQLAFDPQGWRELYGQCAADPSRYSWTIDSRSLEVFREAGSAIPVGVGQAEEATA